ncbi:MAG: hypothetical protein N3G22_01640 [Candidatus Micrarchaeota archaeon]|nr:hypothetical protein [Candidatus Micrarchaeota archaeon]
MRMTKGDALEEMKRPACGKNARCKAYVPLSLMPSENRRQATTPRSNKVIV